MAHVVTNPKVDAFIGRADKWQEEFEALRNILLDCQLSEALKWGVPTYMFDNTNVVLMHGFKDYCALLFFKGSLLSDPNGLLVQQTENVQVSRQIRFTDVKQINKLKTVLRNYILEAITVESQDYALRIRKARILPYRKSFSRSSIKTLPSAMPSNP